MADDALTHPTGRRRGDPVRVLVTGAGGPAAVAFMEGLRQADELAAECWAVDIDPCAAGLYLVPRERRGLVPRGDHPGFVDALLEWCERDRIDVVVPTVDSELIPVARRAGELADRGAAVLAPSVATLERCLDKWALIQACGPEVAPRGGLLDGSFDPEVLGWPLLIKPRQGSGSRGIRLVEDIAAFDRLPLDGSLLAQEYLPGTEYSVDTLAYRDGRVAAVVPRSRLKVDSGIAVAGCSLKNPELEAAARAVAATVALTCVANIQFREDATGRPRLLEVNPRFPGAMPLTVASGVNMPALAVADLLGRPVPYPVDFRPVAMVRHWAQTFLAVDEFEATGEPPPLGLPS
ncbi:MAG TPA: ATP-grasp domain-containing protein [Acidimicrobiales bacterium]|nr:ATP-grasp domain-containing protein [Acidimicrobiales bacterium]